MCIYQLECLIICVYVRNYNGSSGAMESDGIILILKQLCKKYKDSVFVEIEVTDTYHTQVMPLEVGKILAVSYILYCRTNMAC